MSDFDEKVAEYLRSKAPAESAPAPDPLTAPAPEMGPPAEAVTAPPADPASQNTPAQPPESTPTPAASSATPETTPPPTVDYAKFLEEISGGQFKSPDDVKAWLPKIGEYDQLKAQHAELTSKLEQDPFANAYVKQLNELMRSGANKEQLKAFQAINEVGNLDELHGVDAKVMKLVLVDGMKESVARRMVEREFPMDDEMATDEEKEEAAELLRISSKADLEALKKYKADASAVPQTTDAADNARLEAETRKLALLPKIKYAAAQAASAYSGLGTQNLNGKEGAEAINFELKVPQGYAQTAQSMIEGYLADQGIEPSAEALQEAQKYVHANYLLENIHDILRTVGTHVEATVAERIRAEYENRSSGIPRETPQVQSQAQDKAHKDWLKRVASGTA